MVYQHKNYFNYQKGGTRIYMKKTPKYVKWKSNVITMLDVHIYVKITYTYVPMCMQACSRASQEVLRTCGHLWDWDQETTVGH